MKTAIGFYVPSAEADGKSAEADGKLAGADGKLADGKWWRELLTMVENLLLQRIVMGNETLSV